MFTTFIVQPVFNVLTSIYALIPGHNFGVAIILFTILARIVLFPFLKKQLRHTKAMRDLQPEIKKIKEKTKGNRQQESMLTMELYKEREIKPMAFIGLLVMQLIIFLALFSGLNRVVNNPQEVYDFSYPAVQNLSTMQELENNTDRFDNTLVGVVDLGRPAIGGDTGFYLPAFILVVGSTLIQFFQIKQTMPSDKQSRKLRDILKDANTGKQADSSEVNAAMSRNMGYVLPAFIFVITVGFPAALSLYWFTSGLVAYLQQSYLLKQEEYALTGPTAEVVSKKPLRDDKVKVTQTTKDTKGNATSSTPNKNKKSKAKKSSKSSKKRKR